MTSPSGPSNFEYSDDSVVARLSFDVPPQALTDVTQLTQALSAFATQQEYVARSAGTWMEYMQQMPDIMQRANQAYRETITQLERMSYIQNEMGSGPMGGGNVSPGAAGGPQGGGYSTAAPAGYNNPFAGQFFGMGMTPDLMGAQQHLSMMASQDPRLYANMMAARGQAVNPALLGMVGGTAASMTGQGGLGGTGGGQGWGNAAPGSQSPQATQSGRDAAAPPDPAQSGQSTKSEPQNIPAEPHEDAPPWQKTVASTISGAQQVVNEAKMGGGGRASSMLGLASAGMAAAGKWSANNPNALGGMAGRLGGIAKGAGIVGAGAAALGASQSIGEEITKYQQLGSVQGGGAATGLGYEAQARLLALNPFITTQQARQAMQMALSAGFRGGDFDTVQDYMLSNFKDLGIQFSESMAIARANANNLKPGESQAASDASSAGFLRALKEFSAEGGAALPSRVDQAAATTQTLTALGVSQDSIQRGITGLQEGYGDKPALRDSIGGIGDQLMKSPQLLQLAANRNGISGFLPGALAAGLTDKGMDQDQILESAAGQIAKLVSGYPERLNRIAAFQALMGQQGVQMDWPQAEALYDKVTGDKKPTDQAKENVQNASKPNVLGQSSIWSMIKGVFTDSFNMSDSGLVSGDKENRGSVFSHLNDRVMGHDPGAPESNDAFLARGKPERTPPSTSQEAAQTPVRTEGQVSGNVTITVDQSGKVTAPQSIQLSGQQKSANAGYGNAQLNNAPPGDPSFNHSYNSWGGTG